MFWFGHRFETPLLLQSFVMIAGMLAMMEICVRVKDRRSTYTISAIGLGNNNQRNRSRRFLNNGKGNRDGTNNESSPIYSVLSSSSSTSSSSHQTIEQSSTMNYQSNSEESYYRSLQQPDILVRGGTENSNSGNSSSSCDVVSICSNNNGSTNSDGSLVLSHNPLQERRSLTWLLWGRQQPDSINQAIKCELRKEFNSNHNPLLFMFLFPKDIFLF